jgi:N-acetylmuramoyl-L-alanine amidase
MPAWMDPNKIDFITIHCAATPAGRDVKHGTIADWDIAKFGQISYHYVIELAGTVVATLRHDQKGAHVGGHNTGNLGICYVGGMDAGNHSPEDSRTPAQRTAMAVLVKQLHGEHPHAVIRGHRDWPGVNKACPSFDVAHWLHEIGL